MIRDRRIGILLGVLLLILAAAGSYNAFRVARERAAEAETTPAP